ncbi:hypothetical protein ACFL9T_15250 [Thermodesulfobacteriota bacterium]
MLRQYINIHALRNKEGFAFVLILGIIAITTALSLSFLQKAGIGTSATATRFSAMQAHYLARSATNHALWRLLNDPNFSTSGTSYYMHDLGAGRYGHKVRKPTLTKFGTVATVGGVSNAVTRQSYVQYLKPYDIITLYDKNLEEIPQSRRLLGASLLDPSDTANDGLDTAQWMVLKGCPKRKEMIMGTLDNAFDINFVVWNGSTWGNLIEFTQDAGTNNYRSFDVAYENQSGKALVLARDATDLVRYNIWNGSGWASPTAQTDASITPEGNISYLTMASNPISNEILIAEVQNSNDLKLVRWDGSSFTDYGEIEQSMGTDKYGSAVIVYEQQSGDALILYNIFNNSQINYRVWSGTSLSPIEYQAPDFIGNIYTIRAAADPNSDYILVVAVDKKKNLNVAVWDGNAWTGPHEIETAMDATEGQNFDVAWEYSGDEVVVAWGSQSSGGNRIRHYTWRKGTALSAQAVQSGPDFQNEISKVRLCSISNTQKIILLVENTDRELRYSLWIGNTFLGDPGILLDPNLAIGDLPFNITESGVTYTGGSG